MITVTGYKFPRAAIRKAVVESGFKSAIYWIPEEQDWYICYGYRLCADSHGFLL